MTKPAIYQSGDKHQFSKSSFINRHCLVKRNGEKKSRTKISIVGPALLYKGEGEKTADEISLFLWLIRREREEKGPSSTPATT